MLYLEDYVELIEHLPVDLRDRFTDMREMDLQVQNTVDDLNGKVKDLFKQCAARKGKIDNADDIFDEIRSTYYKALEDADEKVQLANQIYDLVDRHLRKLDQELAKFKMELEADNAGITEILERRSLELNNGGHGSSGGQYKRRHTGSNLTISSSQGATASITSNGSSLEKKIKMEHLPELGLFQSDSAPPSVYVTHDSSAPVSGNDSDLGNSRPSSRNSIVGSSQPQVSAVQLAAAQAVQVTAEMQVGRRTSSLKASYDAVKGNEFPVKVQPQDDSHDGPIGLSLSNSQSTIVDDLIDDDSSHSQNDGLVTSPHTHISRPSRTKKQTSRAAAWTQERMQAEARRGHARDKDHSTSTSPNSSVVELVGEGGTTVTEWTCDPNEPRYCVCNQVSYGEMVGCDNEKCTIEWFHYGCVGLAEAPKGKWYCPQCTQTMKRRNRR